VDVAALKTKLRKKAKAATPSRPAEDYVIKSSSQSQSSAEKKKKKTPLF
jgi:hypothetical protein